MGLFGAIKKVAKAATTIPRAAVGTANSLVHGDLKGAAKSAISPAVQAAKLATTVPRAAAGGIGHLFGGGGSSPIPGVGMIPGQMGGGGGGFGSALQNMMPALGPPPAAQGHMGGLGAVIQNAMGGTPGGAGMGMMQGQPGQQGMALGGPPPAGGVPGGIAALLRGGGNASSLLRRQYPGLPPMGGPADQSNPGLE